MPSPSPIVLRLLALAAAPLAAAACLSAFETAPRAAPRAAAPASPGPGAPTVWISNEGSGDLTVIDTARDEVIATVPVGRRPRGIRADRSGERVFVALSGSPRTGPPGARGARPAATVEAADRAADGIAVVDAAARRLATVLPSGRDPEAFDLLPDGRTLVVSNEETATASFVDIEAARVVRSVEVGEEPEGVGASPDGALVAVTSEGDHRVDLVDPGGRVIARVPTCDRPRNVVFARDGALAFATCEESAAVAVLDVPGRRALGEIRLPPGSRPMGAALSPDGRRLYVSNGRAGTVSAIDVASLTVAATATGVGARCWGIAVAPDGRKLYVANGPSDDVSVLDAATLAVLKRIPVGALPWGVAIAGGR